MILGYVKPQRQTFKSNAMEMSQAGIDHGLWRDIYVSMGVKLSDSEYLIRISYKPLASWIWLGAIFMMLGGAIAAWPLIQTRRVKQAETLRAPIPSSLRETIFQ